MDSKKKLNPEEKIALHTRMAKGYRDAYKKERSKQSMTFDGWAFAPDATYRSPYFTGDMKYSLSDFSVDAVKGTTNETQAYLLTFPDWCQTDFQYWAAENGFVMKTRWEGHHKDTGEAMGFYSYSFVETNEYGEVKHWETHTNDEYSIFLDAAIGVHGPFRGKETYNDALERVLKDKYLA